MSNIVDTAPIRASRLSPLNQRRLANFRANRRGWWNFWIFLVLFVVTLILNIIALTIVRRYRDIFFAMLNLTGIRPPGVIVANDAPVAVTAPLEPLSVDSDVLATYGADVEFADLLDPTVEWPRHDPARLGGVLGRLISTGPA